ncbi:hypothetical protein PBAC_04610 [Pedobacter glucosidilyticus]|nr:hypothetical protein [Pedobacter glucosidilyticus]KHJ39473.1 hypothetical protein PBAC_04610 [Pedobacter glucosidilyticus]
MKRIFLSVIFALTIVCAVQAQEAKPAMSKEQAAALKEARAKEEQEIFAKSGLTEADIVQVKAISKEIDQKVREVKKEQISEEDQKAKLKVLSAERKEKIIAAIGEAKYKAWQQERKAVADAKKAAAPTTN